LPQKQARTSFLGPVILVLVPRPTRWGRSEAVTLPAT
jgi:hypothetical protein